jgi:hypothetical protein
MSLDIIAYVSMPFITAIVKIYSQRSANVDLISIAMPNLKTHHKRGLDFFVELFASIRETMR